MSQLYENWYLIVAAVCCAVVIGLYVHQFTKLPTQDKLKAFKQSLCVLVTQAEAELGSGRGKEKLSLVYNKMVKLFPFTTMIMSEETFNMLVNGALFEVGIWVKG